MAVREYFILHKSQAETGGGPFTSVSGYPQQCFLGNFDKARFYLAVSAMSGTTPSLAVWIEEYDLLTDNWVYVAGFAAQTAATPAGSGATGDVAITLDVNPLMAQAYRCNWTLTGTTPSATFTVGAWCGSAESIPS